MNLTTERFYWWCKVPATQAAPAARYHFLLNDNIEVMDPAGRAVQDRGKTFNANFGDDPKKPEYFVVDGRRRGRAYAAAHKSPGRLWAGRTY